MLSKGKILIGAVCLLLEACTFSSKPQQAEALSIAFTGDVLLDRGVRQQIMRKGADWLFSGVSSYFKQCDAVVVNLECPFASVAHPVHKRFIFRAEPDWCEALSNAGVTHAALANNHSIDQGRDGLAETISVLDKYGIVPIGVDTASTRCRPIVIKKGSVCVACFNAVLLSLENWVYLDDNINVCQSSATSLAQEIRRYKTAHPRHWVVAVLHWGVEYQSQPSVTQRREALILLNAGADAIIGHHPHVVQEGKYINGKPVFFSLGNFIFDSNKPETSAAEMVRLDFTSDTCRSRVIPIKIKKCRPEIVSASQ